MFDSSKQALEKELEGLVLPKDAEEIQLKVSKYLNSMFKNDGEYRLYLTQAENFIFNDIVKLLNVQQDLIKEFINNHDSTYALNEIGVGKEKKNRELYTLLGIGVGGAIGTFLGTWGAVFGAILGAAIVIYCSSLVSSKKEKFNVPKIEIPQSPIDVKAFLDIVKKICERVDELIATFRNQIRRVENAYKREEKPSFIKDYSSLSDRLEELFKLAESEYSTEKLLSHIGMVKRSLKNYGVVYEDGKLKNK